MENKTTQLKTKQNKCIEYIFANKFSYTFQSELKKACKFCEPRIYKDLTFKGRRKLFFSSFSWYRKNKSL